MRSVAGPRLGLEHQQVRDGYEIIAVRTAGTDRDGVGAEVSEKDVAVQFVAPAAADGPRVLWLLGDP